MKRILSISFFTLSFFLFSCSPSPSSDTADTSLGKAPVDSGREGSNTILSGSGPVMLQAFNWSSNHKSRYGLFRADDSSSAHCDWYTVIKNNSSAIKNTFEYAWFPPPSDSGSENGYLPRKLNVLDSEYGSSSNLNAAISSIDPSKALADVVINHRVGTSNWGTFTDPDFGTVSGSNYYAICSDDEGFYNRTSDMYDCNAKGNSDTGEGYGSARDIDHQNYEYVQCGIVTWMNDVLKNAGFTGWRYDYVKGYGGRYVGYYNTKTQADFSVGEYWPTTGFSSSNPAAYYNEISSWIESTDDTVDNGQNVSGTKARAFDFVTKGALNTVFGTLSTSGTFDYSLLNNEYLLFKKMPSYAVTFVDNHDTGSTQSLWPLKTEYLACAYAFILTHPGYPCIAWQHYFSASQSSDTDINSNKSQYMGSSNVPGLNSVNYQDFLKTLIALRSECGISENASLEVLQADTVRYYAKVTGSLKSLYLVLGTDLQDTPAIEAPFDYELLFSGTGFQIYKLTE